MLYLRGQKVLKMFEGLQTFEEHLIKRIDDISTSAERLSCKRCESEQICWISKMLQIIVAHLQL